MFWHPENLSFNLYQNHKLKYFATKNTRFIQNKNVSCPLSRISRGNEGAGLGQIPNKQKEEDSRKTVNNTCKKKTRNTENDPAFHYELKCIKSCLGLPANENS